MKLANLIVAATLVPALAYAQAEPQQPQPAQQPQQPQQPQAPQLPQQPQQPAPGTVVGGTAPQTTVVTPGSPQGQPPVVVVNPQQQAAVPPAEAYNPEGTEIEDAWNAPVFTTSALVFAGSYGASAIVAGTSNHPGADRLYVPVLGPWLALSDWGHCPVSEQSCDRNTTDKVLLVGDGIFQAASLIGMLDGIIQPSHHRVVTTTRTVHVAPTSNGVMAFGSF